MSPSNDVGYTPPNDLLRPGPNQVVPPPSAAAASAPASLEIDVSAHSLADLLARYPQGFTVSASGWIFAVEAAHSSGRQLLTAVPLAPPGGGYYVVRPTNERIQPK